MYTYMYIYIYIHTYTYMHIYIYTYIYMHILLFLPWPHLFRLGQMAGPMPQCASSSAMPPCMTPIISYVVILYDVMSCYVI